MPGLLATIHAGRNPGIQAIPPQYNPGSGSDTAPKRQPRLEQLGSYHEDDSNHTLLTSDDRLEQQGRQFEWLYTIENLLDRVCDVYFPFPPRCL